MEFHRCYCCMEELPVPGAVCPHCGYDNTVGPSAQPSHVLPCGTVLNGQYVVGRSLGQGGFGITYIGYDLNLELPVCIKEYYPEGSASRSAVQSRQVYWGTSENAQRMKASRGSFVKEAQKAVKLRDLPHIVSVWGVFYENETSYIVMDYVQGETLKDKLVRTQQPLTERECLALLGPVMEDLGKAHTRGIVHRDIKPDNIMLNREGQPVLLDMGAAKDLGKGNQNGGTPSSMMVVSQGFSPPEQYRQNSSIGPWTDVYAMAATMYYCITGKVLPPAVDRIYEDKADFSGLSPAFARVLEKALAVRPEERIRSTEELRRALEAALEPNPKPKPILPLLAGAVVLAALVLLGLGIGQKSCSGPVVAPTTSSAETSSPEPVLNPTPESTPTPVPTPSPSPTPTPEPTPYMRSDTPVTSGEFYLQSVYDGNYLGFGATKRNPTTGKSGYYLALVDDISSAIVFSPAQYDGNSILLKATNVSGTYFLDTWTSTWPGCGADLWVDGRAEDQRWIISMETPTQYIVYLQSNPNLVLRNVHSTQNDLISVGERTNDDRQRWHVVSTGF